MDCLRAFRWNEGPGRVLGRGDPHHLKETRMLKGGLLWLIGIPIPIILAIYFFTGWLH
jgi:hypothetical protein